MAYRITKDCGAGWDEWCESDDLSWGVSDRQLRLAKTLRAGDVFLHFIDHVQVWGGYSEVVGALKHNDRDSNNECLSALPWVIPVKKIRCLKKESCQATLDIPGLSHSHFHRQAAFSEIREDDGKLIVAAIDSAAEIPVLVPTPEFESRWCEGADGYYSQIVKTLANGKCWLCGMTAADWMERARLTDTLTDSIKDGFLDAAHVVPRRDDGPATPDNLRALCPNCHRIVDRLEQGRCTEVLGGHPD